MFNLIHSLLTKKAVLDVYIQDGRLLVRHHENGVETDYRLHDKHQDKLLSYKTLSGALKFAQANDITQYYNQSKQIIQELIAEAKAEVTLVCPEPALTDDGQPLQIGDITRHDDGTLSVDNIRNVPTAESTPQDKTLSNGVPVSDVCQECGEYNDYCTCETCADCGVIAPLVGGHTQCKECYQLNEKRENNAILSRIERWGKALQPIADNTMPKAWQNIVLPSSKHTKETEFLHDGDIPPMYGLGV